jgi:hypothetical protein
MGINSGGFRHYVVKELCREAAGRRGSVFDQKLMGTFAGIKYKR